MANAQRIAAEINEQTDCHATFTLLDHQDRFQDAIAQSDLYVDATGLGMGKLVDQALVTNPAWFHPNMTVFDTVYAPSETKLMRVALQANVAHILNGQGMLLNQGAAAFKLWTGQAMPIEQVREYLFREDQ